MTARAPLAMLALCCAVVGAAAQEMPSKEARGKALREGTHIFRRILHDDGFTALNGYDDLRRDPGTTLLVVLGNLEDLKSIPGGLPKFLRDGGAALIASDRTIRDPDSRKALRAAAGVSISNETLVCHTLTACYNFEKYYPFLVGGDASLFGQDKKQLRVATNVPSMLLGAAAGTRPVAWLPAGCAREVRGREVPFEGNPLFAVAAEPGTGRLLVLADHSVFINEMMYPKETNNVEFTQAALEYLHRGGRRTRVLFLEEGGVQTKLDVKMKSVRLPVEEALQMVVEKRNELAAEAQRWVGRKQSGFGHGEHVIAELENYEGGRARAAGAALIFATLLLLMYLLYRVGVRERFGHDRAEPLAAATGARLPDRPLAAQRVEAMVDADDIRDLLSQVARTWLAARGVAPPDGAKSAPPAWRLTGGWWARRSLAARLDSVWRLAAGAHASRAAVSSAAWWQGEMDDLAARQAKGEWAGPEQQPRRRDDDRGAA